MGVPGLWSHLSPAGTSHNLETLDLRALVDSLPPTTDGAPQRLPIIGVDLSAWLFHARLSVEGSNPILRLIFFRLARLLSLPINAVFVFDGPLRPRVKRGRTVGAKKHPLTGPLMEMIATFGAIGWEAPGEAEAELARMNQEGLIDAVLSDDVDSLVFGAQTVMRNWSPTLSQARPATAEDGGDNLATIYRASNIRELPDLVLDQDGLILVALMAGGDYDVGGLGGCGVKTALGLAQAGHGQSLLKGFRKHCKIDGHDPETKLPSVATSSLWSPFLKQWLSEVCDELQTNKQGFLNGRHPKLAQSDAFKFFLGTQDALEVLASYVCPVTTWSLAEEENGSSSTATGSSARRKLKFRDPDLPAMASFAQRTFAWGPKATVGRLRNVAWKGLLLQELRRGRVVRMEGQSDAEDEPTASKDKNLRLEILKIHGERRHAGTGQLLEYRLEWNPRPLAEDAEKGIDPLLNVGPGYDEDFPEDMPPPSQSSSRHTTDAEDTEEELPPCSPYGLTLVAPGGCPPSPSKRKAKPPPDPYSTVRTWILADRLKANDVGNSLVEDYRQALQSKEKSKGSKKTTTTAKTKPAAKKKAAGLGHITIDSIFTSRKGSTPSASQQPAKGGMGSRPFSITPLPATALSESGEDDALGHLRPTLAPSAILVSKPSGNVFSNRTFGRTQSGPASFSQPGVDRGALAEDGSDDDDDTFVLYSDDDTANVTLAITHHSRKAPTSSKAAPAQTTSAVKRPGSHKPSSALASSDTEVCMGTGADEADPDASLPDAMDFLRTIGQRSKALPIESSPSPRRVNVKRAKRGTGLREGSPPPAASATVLRTGTVARPARSLSVQEGGRTSKQLMVSRGNDQSDSDGDDGFVLMAATSASVCLHGSQGKGTQATRFYSRTALQDRSAGGRTNRAPVRGGRKSDAIVLSDSD